EANFVGAGFSGDASSRGAAFSGRAKLGGATFSDDASFRGATFGEKASFVNAEMKGETSFEGAVFKMEPPHFFGAKLHEGTVWRYISWPKPKDKYTAGSFIDAYACLKLEMDRLKKHEDELDFFALEMQSRRVWLGTWTGLPIAIYGAFSDYGRSYFRPLVALFYLALTGTLAFLSSDSLSPWQSLGLSFVNSLNVFGFRKEFFDARMIECLPAWLDVISALQTILGTILLFLVGLGIRNKFRMK
ncbi:MAG: pentapeptide repeat-containing protein, partial [Methylocella sp.]